VSYADFITLLFAFFTSLYAISTVNETKFVRLSGALSSAFKQSASYHDTPFFIDSGADPSISLDFQRRFSGRYRSLLESMKGLSSEYGIKVVSAKEGITIRVPGGTLFKPGSSELNGGAVRVLSNVALTLKGLHRSIRIEGHTDNVPTLTKAYATNWDLSSARALRVLKFFVKRYDFDPTLISATGYGEFHPLSSNDTLAGRRLNRRVDIVLAR